MKSILYVFAGLLFVNLACTHTSVKQQNEKKMNTGNKEQSSMNTDPNLDDYTGDWKVEKKAHGCSPIKIEKGPAKNTIQITRKSAVYTVSKDSSFDSSAENTISDFHKYKLSTSTIAKFIRGKIVSAHIWAPNTNAWLGVGLRTWTLDNGTLIKRKAGLTMQSEKDPKENDSSVFKLSGDDVLFMWQIECKYTKAS